MTGRATCGLFLLLSIGAFATACGSSDAAPPPPSGQGGSDSAGTGGTGVAGTTGTGGTASAGKGGSGTGGAATAGTGGTATAGAAGKAGSGPGGAGGTANAGAGGTGTAGSGTAGSGTAGSGTAGSGTAGSGGTPVACTNAMDAPIVAMKDATANNASMCGQMCFLNGNQEQCATDCMKMKSGFSMGCASCWGAVIACGIKNCAGQCIGGSMSQGCIDCNNMFCVPAFDTCAGKP